MAGREGPAALHIAVHLPYMEYAVKQETEHEKQRPQKPQVLPMSAFEEYMYWDSMPGYPMDCYTRLCWSGSFSHSDLEQALEQALQRHPLLKSRRKYRRKESKPAWVIAPSTGIQSGEEYSLVDGVRVYWSQGPCRTAYPPAAKVPLDLDQEPPMRLVVQEEVDADGRVLRTDLAFKFHHAVSDALGANRFISEFLILYAQRLGADPEIWKDYEWAEPKMLPTRSWCGKTFWGWVKRFFVFYRWYSRIPTMLFRRILPLAKNAEAEALKQVDASYPAMLFQALSPEQTIFWVKTCKQRGGTLNDFLLHAAFLALKDWREAHPEQAYQEPDGRRLGAFRIAVPTNLRNQTLAKLPAANMVSMTFVDRWLEQIAPTRECFQSLHQEMKCIKDWELGFILVMGMMDVQRYGLLRRMIRVRDCWASMVVTNIGRAFDASALPFPRDAQGRLQAGEATLETLDGASPIRPLTSVSLSSITYAGRMFLTLHYDSRLMNEALAQDFFQRVTAQMEILLENEGWS